MKLILKQVIILCIFLLLISQIFLISGCINNEAQDNIFKDLSPGEAFNIVQKNKNDPNFIILDVRTPEEYADGHIENAVNLDFRNENFKEKLSKLDKNKIYFVYCQGGVRSGEAIIIMRKMGFKRIYHLPAGFMGWEEESLPLKEKRE